MLLLILPSLAVGCSGTDFDQTQTIDPSVGKPTGKADIYGTDDRREVFEAEAVYQKVANSTAVVVTTSDFYIPSSGNIWLRNISYTDKIRGTLGAPLCRSERFREQPAPGYCSAFLVAPDLVATAGHCINQRYTCDDIRFVFGYEYEAK